MPLGANKAAIMGVAGVSTGDVVLLSSQTASGDASISFTSGIDSTYGEYIFRLYVMNPATDEVDITFQANATDTADYNDILMTTTYWDAYHYEDDSGTPNIGYDTGRDQAQAAGFQVLAHNVGNGADECLVGELHLFNPASTTYVKHFYYTGNKVGSVDISAQNFVAGYFNTTTAIDDVQFKYSSGNFDGKIKMWGVK